MSSSIIKPPEYKPFLKERREFPGRFPNGFPIGERTKRRQSENRELNKLKINHCELMLKGCLKNKLLTWAHPVKSRFLVTSKDWQEAARACLSCHQRVEAMSHREMARIIREAIARRKQTECV